MSNPYTTLGEQLLAAAARQQQRRGAVRARLPWHARRLPAVAIAVGLLLACSAIAVAATGVLDGSPVKPEVAPNPNAGNGVPVANGRGAGVALLASDPAGGLSWGLRVLHTTRDQVCAQVGRVQDGQLGELGVDGAFGNDGRFHPLSAGVLPPGYGGSTSQTECASPGQIWIFEQSKADRNGMRRLPGEREKSSQSVSVTARPVEGLPPARDLRALAYGLLGPHAVSITYHTSNGLRTVPIRAGDGAFLLVQATGDYGFTSLAGGSTDGEAGPNGVMVIPEGPQKSKTLPIVSAVTFRFGARLCSQGVGAPVQKACPRPHLTPIAVRRHWFSPTRNLHEPIGLKLLPQSHAACAAASLRYPCYKGQISFVAPYRVDAARTDYNIDALANCKVGGRPETAWFLERDVRAHEFIRTISLGRFVYTPKCVSSESFRVTYLNPRGPSRMAPHESVIVGSVSMKKAVLPRDSHGPH